MSALRGLLVLLLGWWTVSLSSGLSRWCFLDLANLAFHEAGHVFLGSRGSTLHYLGGTFFQLLIPALLAAYFLLRRRDVFAAAVCTWWLGESANNVRIYMADARDLALPLVGGGDHDWNELFHRFGLLGESSVASIAGTTRALAIVLMLVGLTWSVWWVLPDDLRRRASDPLLARWPKLSLLLEA